MHKLDVAGDRYMVRRNNYYFTHLFGEVNIILLRCKI